jgi:hypothetical protein
VVDVYARVVSGDLAKIGSRQSASSARRKGKADQTEQERYANGELALLFLSY